MVRELFVGVQRKAPGEWDYVMWTEDGWIEDYYSPPRIGPLSAGVELRPRRPAMSAFWLAVGAAAGAWVAWRLRA